MVKVLVNREEPKLPCIITILIMHKYKIRKNNEKYTLRFIIVIQMNNISLLPEEQTQLQDRHEMTVE